MLATQMDLALGLFFSPTYSWKAESPVLWVRICHDVHYRSVCHESDLLVGDQNTDMELCTKLSPGFWVISQTLHPHGFWASLWTLVGVLGGWQQ